MIFSDDLNTELEQLFRAKSHSLRGGKRDNAASSGPSINSAYSAFRFSSNAAQTRRNFEILSRIGNNEPEVYIGIKGKQVSASHTAANFIYISRIDRSEDQHVQLETDDGQTLKTIAEMTEHAADWHYHNQLGNNRRTGALSRSLVLSMPENTDPQKLLTAARGFAEEEFSDRKYVMALHTDTEHPHVHLTIATRNNDLKRINITRDMLQDWRKKFAEKLRDQGIDANATSRIARGYYNDRSPKHHAKKGDKHLIKAETPQSKLNEANSKTIYSRVVKELEKSESFDHKFLALWLDHLAYRKRPQDKATQPPEKAGALLKEETPEQTIDRMFKEGNDSILKSRQRLNTSIRQLQKATEQSHRATDKSHQQHERMIERPMNRGRSR